MYWIYQQLVKLTKIFWHLHYERCYITPIHIPSMPWLSWIDLVAFEACKMQRVWSRAVSFSRRRHPYMNKIKKLELGKLLPFKKSDMEVHMWKLISGIILRISYLHHYTYILIKYMSVHPFVRQFQFLCSLGSLISEIHLSLAIQSILLYLKYRFNISTKSLSMYSYFPSHLS